MTPGFISHILHEESEKKNVFHTYVALLIPEDELYLDESRAERLQDALRQRGRSAVAKASGQEQRRLLFD